MRIDISMKELARLHTVAAALLKSRHERSYRQGYGDAEKACAGRGGSVSHTVAKTGDAPAGGADFDIDKHFGESAGERDSGEAYARAEAVASFIIRNLLDFEAWLDERLFNDDDAAVERVRFHAEVSHDGRSITMHSLTEYKNADRCNVPREDGRIRKWAVPPDDGFLEDFEAGAVRSCIEWACNEFGIEMEEYLDRDGKAGGAEQDGEKSVHNEVCVESTEKAMVDVPGEEAAYVYGIVKGRLSALERWAESKAGKPVISVGVTLSGNTVLVKIIEHSDMECEPLMVSETKVGKRRDKCRCADRILSEAYNVVFGTFEELSYIEFIDSISVAADGR